MIRDQERRADETPYLEERGDTIVLYPASQDLLARAALLAFGAPPLALGATALALWLTFRGSPLVLGLGWSAGALLAAAGTLTGVVRMLSAERRAERQAVRVDLAERLVLRPGHQPEVLRTPQAVAVSRWGLGWQLGLRDTEGRTLPLLKRLPRGRGRQAARAAERLAERLGTQAVIPDAARKSRPLWPTDPRTQAALCYVPIDGLFWATSLWALMTSPKPFVRFAAKQSLSQLGLTAIVGVLLAGCLGVPLFALSPPLGVGEFVCVLVPLLFLRVAVRWTAAARARRGRAWALPWLAWLIGREPPP